MGPDGTATVEWDGIPHLYQRETLAVVYIGTNPATLCAMAQLFGKVQAGVPFYPANPISSADDLVNALIAADITAEVTTETVSQDFLSVEGQIVMIEGTAVQVYDYAANPFAFAEFEQISPTGTSVGTISISWMNKPHFYRGDYLLVIYVGTDADVLRVLDDVFGAQFAGG